MSRDAEQIVHAVTFKGRMATDWPAANGARLVIADEHVRHALQRSGFAEDAAATIYQAGRPTAAVVEKVADVLRARQIRELVAIGNGALLDAGKLAYQVAASSQDLRLVLVPCGAEPYRAVTAFAVVDHDDGSRPTTVDPHFAAADVLLIDELLATVSRDAVAVHALDTAVQAIESLLSLRANPLARALASCALAAVAEEFRSADVLTPAARTKLTLASFLAAEAFTSTRLGIAHALASPLGAEVGMTHDRINGILGAPMIELWGAEVGGFADVASALAVKPTLPAVLGVLSRMRTLAGLPQSLAELGVPWAAVESVLPKAAKSSGMSVLARPIEDEALEEFAQRAWRIAPKREVLDATAT